MWSRKASCCKWKTINMQRWTITVLCCASVVAMGIYYELTGPTLPDLMLRVDSNYEEISRIFIAQNAAYLLGCLAGGVLCDSRTDNLAMIIGVCNMAVALATAAAPWARQLWLLALCLFLQGCAIGPMVSGGNAWLIWVWGEQASGPNYAYHWSYGIGAMIAPQLAKPFLGEGSGNHPITRNQTANGSGFNTTQVDVFSTQGNLNENGELSANMSFDHLANDAVIQPSIEFAYMIVASLAFCIGVAFLCVHCKQRNSEKVPDQVTEGEELVTLTQGGQNKTALGLQAEQDDELNKDKQKECNTQSGEQNEKCRVEESLENPRNENANVGSYGNGSNVQVRSSKNLRAIVWPGSCMPGGNAFYGTVMIILIFVYHFLVVAGERSWGKFQFSFLKERAGDKFRPKEASDLQSAFWLSFFVSRGAAVIISRWVKPHVFVCFVMLLYLANAIFMAVFLTSNEDETTMWVTSCIFGVLVAPLFPGGIAVYSRFIDVSAMVMALSQGGAAFGGMLFQWMSGYLLEYKGPNALLFFNVIYVALVFVVFLLILATGFCHKRHLKRSGRTQ